MYHIPVQVFVQLK